MTIPAYTFLQRDAAKSASARAFMDTLLGTRKFWRNEKSQLFFEVAPGDHVFLERKQGLRSILESGEVLRLDGDLDESAFDILWIWLTAAKWRLPRLNPERPWNPPKPAPVAHIPYQAPVLGGKGRS
jgi:hypothetical protein